MTKREINEAFEQWIKSDDFEPLRTKVTEFEEAMEPLRLADAAAQEKAFLEAEGEQEDFEYKADEDDQRFKELLNLYHDKRKRKEQIIAEQEEKSFEAKQIILEELTYLIQEEENIGKAFSKFNELRERWDQAGNVPSSKRQLTQQEYSRLREQFYYNVNIYRELQINDLKKNQELKLEMIEKIKGLKAEKAISQVEFLIHKYLEEWDQIGPTFREEWDKIRAEFHEAVNQVFDRIKAHRKAVKDEHSENFQKKEAIVEQVESIAEREFTNPAEIGNWVKEVINLQSEWKSIGYAGRKKNDEIWKRFRAACDAFFEKRNALRAESSEKLSKVRERKKELIEKAKAIHTSDDRSTADQLKRLQADWKRTEKLMPKEEYRLFKEFRSYCDAFFKRKQQESADRKERFKSALESRTKFLEELEEQLDKVEDKGEALIEEWASKWNELEEAADNAKDKLEAGFEKMLDKAYSKLGLDKKAVAKKKFAKKVEVLSSGSNSVNALKKERSYINKMKAEAEAEVLQLENKMDFFTYSDDTNPLKRDLILRIEKAKQKVDGWKQKRKTLDLTIKEIEAAEKKENSEKPAEED